MDIKKLLDELDARTSGGSKATSGNRERVKNDATEQQQADQLFESFANFSNPPAFKPGDLVRYRKELCDIVRNHDRLHMVYDRIEPPVRIEINADTDGEPTTYRRYDVVIGVTNPNCKDSILKYVADSRDLEYWPDGERLKRQGTA